MDNVPELATPAAPRLCPRFFCAGRHSGETTAVPGSIWSLSCAGSCLAS